MIKRDTSPLGLMMLNAHRPQKETLLAAAGEDGLLLLFSLSLGWVLLELHKPVFCDGVCILFLLIRTSS
jgi:hypothetical protein